jgi:hypothetical protein
MNQNTVYLSDEEAKLYVEFVKNRHLINTLLRAGVFNTKGGSFEVHLDADGVIRVIDIHTHLRM